MQSLSPEQRSAIAGKAARARWGKDKGRRSEIGDQQAPAPATKQRPAMRSAPRPPMRPAPFSGAHKYAEKRLAAALKERAQAMNKLAMLNVEIPSLIQIIKALQGPQNPQLVPAGALDIASRVASDGSLPPAAPQVLRAAQGAAIGGIDLGDETDEDRFLRESPVAGGDWH
jgi:hypothetical protein